MIGRIRFSKNNIAYVLSSIFYKFAVDMLYIFGTSVVYSYLGRDLRFNIYKYCTAWIVFLFFVYLIERILVKRIKFMVKCIFMLSGVSNMSIFGLRDYDTIYFLIVVLFWLLIISICICLPHIKQFKEINRKQKIAKVTFNNKDEFLLLIGLLITIMEVSKFGINVSSFSAIYTARDSFRSQNLSPLDSYLLSWNGTVILPWCFLVSFNRKKYFKAGLSLILAVFMFLINGLKTWLAIYIIIVVFSILLKKKKDFDYSINAVLILLADVILASLFLFLKTSHYEILGILDRIVVLPGEINYYYLDFFSNNEFLFLRESIFKTFASSPYSPWSAVQISQEYMAAAYYHNATNGLIGDMYGNFGLFGVILYPFMIATAFAVLNYMLEGFDAITSAVVVFLLMWLLVNTSFFTWLMTGGFFVYVFILFFYKKYRVKIK